MRAVRLGAVGYLNARPLVHGLDRRPDLFSIRFDVPADCADLLHAGRVDLGLVPAVEYLRGDYRIVPGVAVGSDGPVDSVALFSRVPLDRVRTVALDASSRTSAALVRVLCARHFGIAPRYTVAPPGLEPMLAEADAALLIGDAALHAEAEAFGAIKTDLGAAWREMTGLPFVYAMWAGREGAVGPAHVAALNEARDAGLAAARAIADEHGQGDAGRAARALTYLRDTLRYGLGEAECAGLRRFLELVVEAGIAPAPRPLCFFA